MSFPEFIFDHLKNIRKWMFSFVNTKAYQEKVKNTKNTTTIIYFIALPLFDIIGKNIMIDYIGHQHYRKLQKCGKL